MIKSSIIIEDSGKPMTPKEVAAASRTLSEKSERHLPKAFIISSEIYSWSKSIPSKLESFSWEIKDKFYTTIRIQIRLYSHFDYLRKIY